mgnify:FL=1
MKLSLFLFSCLLAFLGGHMVNYSIIFLALEWFNSHSLAGIGYGLCFGPPIILGWFAGVYCDRYSPRKVLLIAQNSFFIALLLLWLAFDTPLDGVEGKSMRMILLLSAALFSGIGWSFVAPARFATLAYYVSYSKESHSSKKKQKLTAATIVLNLMLMMGFGLAPMLLKQIQVAFNWQAVLLTATVMFALSSLILLPLSFKFPSKSTEYSSNKAFREIKASLLFVKRSSYLSQLLILASIAYLLMGPMQVILPSIAKDNLGLSDVAQGNYLSLVAFSLIVGGLLAMLLKRKGKLGWQLLLAIIFAGCGIGLLALVENLTFSVSLLILSACCGGIAISFIVAGLQHYSSDEHRGRVMSFYTIIGQFIPAASGVGAGLLAQVYTPSIAMVIISGVIIVAMSIALFSLKEVRQLDNYS